jgi:hypothetical protein
VAEKNSDEAELERQLDELLVENEKATTSPWNWEWLNRPITLWLLSTFAVGLIAFSFSNYSACRSAQYADNERLVRLIGEIRFRADNLDRIAGAPPEGGPWVVTASSLAAIHDAFDPNVNFALVEFKGMWPYQLSFELARLLRKWNVPFGVDEEKKTGEQAKRAKILDALLDVTEFPLDSRSVFQMTGNKDLDQSTKKALFDEVIHLVQSARSLMTEQLHTEIGRNFDGIVIRQTACLRRSFWPF